jgi:glutathione S-transferase
VHAGDRQFFGGEDPGLVDIYLHGVLHCVADEDTGRYAFAHAQPRLSAWYRRMQGRFVPSQDDTRTEQQAPAKS